MFYAGNMIPFLQVISKKNCRGDSRIARKINNFITEDLWRTKNTFMSQKQKELSF